MRRTIKRLAYSSAITLIAGTAIADTGNPSISSLPDKGPVTVSGTVANISNEHDFTLHDDTGSIEVKISSGSPVVLKQGDNVTVSGRMERPLWGLMGKDINASAVDVHQNLSSALSNAVTQATGVTMDKADNVQIGKLPAQGMVQISGTIDNVSDPKHFTVKDATGSVNVAVQSDESVVLAKGAEVTVTGYVKNGLFGKTINATHVIATSGAPTANDRTKNG